MEFASHRRKLCGRMAWLVMVCLWGIWAHFSQASGAPGDGLALDGGAPPQPVELFPLAQVWRYDQSGLDLGTAWRSPSYDDAAWAAGPGGLGIDDNPLVRPFLATPLVLETNGQRIITYYFRTHFRIESLDPAFMLVLSNLVDDGAIFYLNGQEVFRQNMPNTAINWQTRASSAIPDFREGTLIFTNLPMTNLVPGDNVLAVEVHQSDSSSTDVVFGLALYYGPQVPLHIVTQPRDAATHEGSGVTLSGKVAGSFPHYQWFRDGVAIPGAGGDSLFIPQLGRMHAGHYHFVATNQLSSVTSGLATLTVMLLEPAEAPVLLQAGPANDNQGGLLVGFDQHLEATSALTLANYAIARADTGEPVLVRAVEFYAGNFVRLATGPLVPGTNYVLAVNHVTNMSGIPIASNSRVNIRLPVSLVQLDGVWKYDDSGNDLGTAWREPGFDDASWASGPDLFYNDENLNLPPGTTGRTLVNVTNVSGQRLTTHYFRQRFTLAALPVNGILSLRYAVDDGAVFYLNGQEMGRFNMPAGVVTAATRASASATEGTFGSQSFTASNLVAGENVLAVEVHQFSLASPDLPDLTFGLEAGLTADSYASVPPVVLRQPVNLTVAERASASFFCDILAATQLQWFREGAPVPGGTFRRLDLPRVSALDDGAGFQVVGWNGLGAVTSILARLSVLPDLDPPQLLGANMGTNLTQTLVSFSEPLDSASAGEAARYVITNELGGTLPVLGAMVISNSWVLLTTGPRANGLHFFLVVEGIRDASARGNIVHESIGVGYEVVHLPWDALWRYNDSGADLGLAWSDLGYNDEAWPLGPGLLGFEDQPLPEPIRTQLPPPEFRGPVYYFRTQFRVSPHPEADAWWLRHLVDDGAVFFLNGREVHRLAVPPDQNYQTLATRGTDATLEGPFVVPAQELAEGRNLLAVEVHQNSIVSADSVLGVLLTEAFDVQPLRRVRPILRHTRAGHQIVLSWERLDSILEVAPTPAGPWKRAPAPTLPYTVSPTSALQFYRLVR